MKKETIKQTDESFVFEGIRYANVDEYIDKNLFRILRNYIKKTTKF